MPPDATVPPPPPPPPPPPASPPEWRASLPADLRDNPAIAPRASVEELAREHVNLQALIGRKGVIPPDPQSAKPEDWDKFHAALGRPKDAAGYELRAPADAPPGFYDEGFAGAFKGMAHKAGLSSRQAAALHDEYVKFSLERHNGTVNGVKQAGDAMEADLRAEWGTAYGAKTEAGTRAVQAALADLKLPPERAQAALNAFEAKAGGADMLRLFAWFGERMAGDTTIEGNVRRGTLTPGEAKAEFRKLQANPAYFDARHPEYKALQSRGAQLVEMSDAPARA